MSIPVDPFEKAVSVDVGKTASSLSDQGQQAVDRIATGHRKHVESGPDNFASNSSDCAQNQTRRSYASLRAQ